MLCSVQFSHSLVYDSLRPHGLQHARPPCPSPTPGACSNSCPSSQWCHPTISSSVIPFSSCLQSFPVLGSLQMSQFFTSLYIYLFTDKSLCSLSNTRLSAKWLTQSTAQCLGWVQTNKPDTLLSLVMLQGMRALSFPTRDSPLQNLNYWTTRETPKPDTLDCVQCNGGNRSGDMALGGKFREGLERMDFKLRMKRQMQRPWGRVGGTGVRGYKIKSTTQSLGVSLLTLTLF